MSGPSIAVTDIGFAVLPPSKRLQDIQLLDLPVELCELLLSRLDSRSLSRLACVCQTLNHCSTRASLWKTLFEERWGIATKNQCQAAEIAGGWKLLFICKQPLSDPAPCKWEIRAAIEKITSCASPKGIACCALIDGSGSMCTGDFGTMTEVVTELAGALKDCPNSQMSVMQFSGRTQVEVYLQSPERFDCAAIMKGVTQMNGGTNVAAAVVRASQEMASLDPDVQRVILFMSDFRIDEYSANEAIATAEAVSQDHDKTTYFAFGVGRLVDAGLCSWFRKQVVELLSAGSPAQNAADGYLWLGHHEDSTVDDY